MDTSTPTLADWRRQADLYALASRDIPDLKAVRGSSGMEWRGTCPVHANATNPTAFHIFVGPDGELRYRCYSCGASGDAFEYLAWKSNTDWKTAFHAFRDGKQLRLSAIQREVRRPIRPAVLPPRRQEILRYHRSLHELTSLGITAYEWWLRQGIGPQTIARYQLGYARRCPTYRNSDSFTLPVTYRDEVLNIRHRLALPVGNTGKYRPQKKHLGAHLFNADALDVSRTDDVLIVGGEKKVLVLVDQGMDSIMPVVASTGGEGSWVRGVDGSELVSRWFDMLMDFRRVFVLFDNEPAMRPIAYRTARIFGRRGYVVWTPGKVDDYVIGHEEGLRNLMLYLSAAEPVLRVPESRR